MLQRSVSILAIFAASLMIGWAADQPNFSGEWTMNAAKSDFGQRPAPEKMVRKITHEGDKLEMATTTVSQMGERTQEAKYVIDGKEHTNSTRMGDVKSVLKWEGKSLVITSKLKFQDNDVTATDKWTLSDDSKELTSEQTFSTAMGEMTMKVVLVKK